ncbi:virulence RhuM family protein [Litoribacter ruber]|uniref:RhuM family protein n=1 Tax=Litoribacter ruber TaxID=702568 RepID=UPI001BDAF77C|nr:RhuM family protein [Litoribacter ruber]MBT0810140.1 virulence RhuM family protein [Litoribacter ruber]
MKNILETGELEADSVVSKMEITAADGKNYETNFYRLEAILAVGYRVNSIQATDFRKWAIQKLNEFINKGFVLDDERMRSEHWKMSAEH